MSKILFAGMILSGTVAAAAPINYRCVNAADRTQVAELVVDPSADASVQWSEPRHSAESVGVLKGYEDAPYSDKNGYQLFRLMDFYAVNDSAYMLALSSNIFRTPKDLKAAVYFDNDDHEEDETLYSCSRR